MSEALVRAGLDRLLAAYRPRPDPEFWGAQFDHGLAWVHFPEGHGGLGVAAGLQRLVEERLTAAGASFDNISRNLLGYGMGAPTVVAHGTDEQKRRWLRPIFTAEEIWCQLFSEPGAGSDLAGLATRAQRDGDEWVINGQKVWTTFAHHSRWGMLLARHDPNALKHDGLTYFILDMRQPGVVVRPLRQITGEAEFNEVYLDGARVPDANRLGGVGEGWRLALTTLMHERVAIGATPLPRGGGAISPAVEAWRRIGRDDPTRRDELMRLWCEAEVLRLTNLRAREAARAGTPGPEGSTAKLHWAELNKRVTALTIDLLGPEGTLYPGGFGMQAPDDRRTPQRAFLRARANSIEGGTSEIMRNILGERVLGLPGEPRADKDVPWKDIPR